MQLPDKIQQLLLRLAQKLPADKRQEFAARIRQRLRDCQPEDLAGYTIAGALVGGVCEALPLDTVTGIDDWVEIGAALGAAAGYAATARQRKTRLQIEQIIMEELRNVLNETD